jgi:hypothetical protein
MNVRYANPIVEDWRLLMTCTYTNMDVSTKESVDKAIHFFATNGDLYNHNKYCLISLNRPIA